VLKASYGSWARSATFLAVLAFALGGCGANSEPLAAPSRAANNSGLDVSATVDRQTGAIVFPGSRYSLTDSEANLILDAGDHAAEICFNDNGISYAVPPVSWDPLYDISNYFGVWTVPVAERFAFVSPMTTADMSANGVKVNGEPVPESVEPDEAWRANDLSSDEAAEVAAECDLLPDVKRFDLESLLPGAWQAELNAAFDLARQTQEWKNVFEEYHECLVGKGIEPDLEDGLAVIGQDNSEINAEQIVLALEVVDCKDQVKLVDRLAGQIAAFQAPVIDKYATDLVAYRAQLDKSLVEAREYLATLGASE
jgi:hypothetical protein